MKICGVRTAAEARQAADAGADAVGVNFYRPSPRYVTPAEAEAIVAALPPFVVAVGLFVDAPAEWIRQVADRCRLSAIQVHGAWPAGAHTGLHGAGGPAGHGPADSGLRAPDSGHQAPDYPLMFGRLVIRALQVRGPESLAGLERLAGDAFLVDGHVDGLRGGTGRAFDWRLVAEARRRAGGRPIILAGGLTPETVAEAVRLARPDGVDVASGVESSAGVKDPDKVARFVRAAKAALSAAAAAERERGGEAGSPPVGGSALPASGGEGGRHLSGEAGSPPVGGSALPASGGEGGRYR